MSASSVPEDEWEFSKENILPLQHGRKPDILKLALRDHPEEPIQQKQQAFENELRTYSGDDPLSVWFKYINWVEQNFLKGGRDGHFENLVKKCVSMFKDDKRYCDDKRFITVWLKFANISDKPIDVFNYMFSQNIGCYTAFFYIAWSWELEQQDNIKKANQVLYEGINRNADPVDKLKSYLSEFEIRVSQKLSEHLKSEQNVDADSHRSAFSILKTHRKAAPVERTGDTVIKPTRSAMTIGHSQPAPKNERESSSKMPFKIYSNKAPASSLPVQKVGNVPFIFHTDSVKENEMKPSKWSKVKVKQTVPITYSSSSKDLNFDFHRDEAPQPICTPRPVPKVSNVLRSRQHSKSPPMALFEPPDPMKCPMYDKNKVYGGAEEFSLEEIRAAAWLKKYNLSESSRSYSNSTEKSHNLPAAKKELGFSIYSDENKKVMPSGQQKRERTKEGSPLRALLSPANPAKYPIYDRNVFYKGEEELSFEEIKANAWFTANKNVLEKTKEFRYSQSHGNFNKTRENECQNPNSPNSYKYTLSSIHTESERVADKKEEYFDPRTILPQYQQEPINILATESQNMKEKNKFDLSQTDSINHPNFKASHNQHDSLNKPFEKLNSESYLGVQNPTENMQWKNSNSTSYCEAANMLAEFYNGTIANPIDAILKNEYQLMTEANSSSRICNTNANQMGLPFTLYQDPTENVLVQNNVKLQDSDPYPNANKAKLPFNIFQEQINDKSMENINIQASNPLEENLPVKSNLPFTFYEDPIENILRNPPLETVSSELMNDDNAENIPPKDYIQDTMKREKSGILTPAQNIRYIPLELQECEDEDPDPEDVQINECALQNETLVPPCNTEQFISAPFISSTPFTSSKNIKKFNQPISEDTFNYGDQMNNAKVDNFIPASQAAGDSANDKQVHRPEKFNGATRPISSLSVIMETSKESYKSSASSGSSASATRLSQFDQYHSYEKSNITHKEYSRADTFKEPKHICVEQNTSNIKKTFHISQVGIDKPELTLHKNVEDPFDIQLTEKLLQSLQQPPNYHRVLDISEKKYRSLKIGDEIEVKNVKYFIEKVIAEGAYGKVFVAEKKLSLKAVSESFCPTSSSKVALKACRHSNEWELYICFTLHERLLHLKSMPDVRLSTMDILAAKKFDAGMILVSEYCPQGTLLDLVNMFKKNRTSVPEELILYLTLELLQTMAKIHECKIIHTDIKPDNVLVRNIPIKFELLDFIDKKTSILQFIDFGRSIDLNFFESGVSFNTPMKSRCSEVLENKPWVFQLDWCGILDCIHTLLFQDYMKVKKNQSGRWCLENRFRRYHNTEIWSPLFDELLNIPACYEEPNISEHVSRIRAKLVPISDSVKRILERVQSMYSQK